MTDLDLDFITYALLQDARLIGCASAEQLAANVEWLVEAQDNIVRALAKARRYNDRKAA